MANNTGRYWDRAWSLVEGCSHVEEGCDNCWAAAQTHMRARQRSEAIRRRYGGLTRRDGRFNGQVRLQIQDLDKPFRRQVLTVWAVWNDLFHRAVPDEFVLAAFERMYEAAGHRFLVLTKRADRMRDFCSRLAVRQLDEENVRWVLAGHEAYNWRPYLPNVGLGVTVTGAAGGPGYHRVDDLLATDLEVGCRYLSCEPLLGPIDPKRARLEEVDWVIAGGETGRGARVCKADWLRALRDDCAAADVPFWLKHRGASRGCRTLDGREHNGLPAMLAEYSAVNKP